MGGGGAGSRVAIQRPCSQAEGFVLDHGDWEPWTVVARTLALWVDVHARVQICEWSNGEGLGGGGQGRRGPRKSSNPSSAGQGGSRGPPPPLEGRKASCPLLAALDCILEADGDPVQRRKH